MKKTLLLVSALWLLFIVSNAQEKEAFKPSGKPVMKVFTNWHQGFGNEDYEDESGFEATRAVFGYSYKFSPNIYSKMVLDVADPSSGKLTEVAYLRNAYIAYKDDRFNAVFGILGMKQFKEQENNWGYRYIYKSAMDHYKFNNSVDAGLYLNYKITDVLSADITISNGEGAKKQQDIEGKYRFGGGVSLRMTEELSFRAYYDYFWASEDVASYADLSTLALFLGYENEVFRIGAEVDVLQNFGFDQVDDRSITSLYASYRLSDKMQAFGRYDMLDNFEAEGFSTSLTARERVAIVGLDYSLAKGVKVAPNLRYVDDKLSNQQGGYFYLNFEYKF